MLQLHVRHLDDLDHGEGQQGRADQGGPLHPGGWRQGQDQRGEAAADLGGAARGEEDDVARGVDVRADEDRRRAPADDALANIAVSWPCKQSH